MIDQDRLHMKLLALNVHFNSVSLDPLDSRKPPRKASNVGTPFKMCDFCYCMSTNLALERLQIDTDLLLSLTTFPGGPTIMTLNDIEIQNRGL